jgi:hypothetical protein
VFAHINMKEMEVRVRCEIKEYKVIMMEHNVSPNEEATIILKQMNES